MKQILLLLCISACSRTAKPTETVRAPTSAPSAPSVSSKAHSEPPPTPMEALAEGGEPIALGIPAPKAPIGSSDWPALPRTVGEVAFAATGCAADGKTTSATRGIPQTPEHVEVTGIPSGVTVRHELSHACCLQARVETRLEGDTVTIDERLEGQPCRCVCESTVRSAIRLRPGPISLRVVVTAPGGTREAYAGRVTIPF